MFFKNILEFVRVYEIISGVTVYVGFCNMPLNKKVHW